MPVTSKPRQVYPGVQHPDCCVLDKGVNSTCCRNSERRVWRGPASAQQADCMFAVKRAICAYHFWECDGSLRHKMFPGVCKDTCDDVPKLCGTIPSTGRPLTVASFTLGKFYHQGCVEASRQYVKDCTGACVRVMFWGPWTRCALTRDAGAGLHLDREKGKRERYKVGMRAPARGIVRQRGREMGFLQQLRQRPPPGG